MRMFNPSQEGMTHMAYLVQFSGKGYKPGAGYIDGYKTAKRAKEVVQKYNDAGFTDVKYLGEEKKYYAKKGT